MTVLQELRVQANFCHIWIDTALLGDMYGFIHFCNDEKDGIYFCETSPGHTLIKDKNSQY